MQTKPTPGSQKVPAIAELAREAYIHLLCRVHNTSSLARATRVPISRLRKALVVLGRDLRRKGMGLRLVGKGRGAHYEIPGLDEETERGYREWHAQLRKVSRMKSRPARWSRFDRAIYGR